METDSSNPVTIFLSVACHPVTGAYFGSIKLNPDAVGLPTGGATFEAVAENARSLGAAYHQVDRSRVSVTVLDGHDEPPRATGAPLGAANAALTCVC